MARNVFHLQLPVDPEDSKNSSTIASISELRLAPMKYHENEVEVQSGLPVPVSYLVWPSLLPMLIVLSY